MSDLEWETIKYDAKLRKITRDVIGPDADPSITSEKIRAEIRSRLQEEEKIKKLSNETSRQQQLCIHDLVDK